MILFVNEQVERERIQTCLACPLVIKSPLSNLAKDTPIQKVIAAIKSLTELRCGVCKCPTKLRAKQAIVGCPRGKWRR